MVADIWILWVWYYGKLPLNNLRIIFHIVHVIVGCITTDITYYCWFFTIIFLYQEIIHQNGFNHILVVIMFFAKYKL